MENPSPVEAYVVTFSPDSAEGLPLRYDVFASRSIGTGSLYVATVVVHNANTPVPQDVAGHRHWHVSTLAGIGELKANVIAALKGLNPGKEPLISQERLIERK